MTRCRRKGIWLLLPFRLRPHCGYPQDRLPLHLDSFQFVRDACRRGKARLDALVIALLGTPRNALAELGRMGAAWQLACGDAIS